MINKLALLIVCIAAACLMANTLYADEPQQSTTGPTPPTQVLIDDAIKGFIMAAPPTSPVVIPNVPNYLWRHGCGPTAVGHVVGYYDGQGYSDLITGDASTQTNDVNQAIASGGDSTNPNPAGSEQHYEDYSCPEDAYPTLLQDDYIGKRPAHPNDCIGDYQDTSKSTRNNYYGWSWSNDLGPSFVNYVTQQNATYNPTYTEYQWSTGALTWNVLKNEIDNGRPMVFLVDSDGDGSTDHFVAVVGYDAPTNQYGCHDSWDNTQIRWETFQGMGSQPWGIWGGWSFNLGTSGPVTKWEQPPDPTPYGVDVRCDQRDGTLRVLADDFQCTMTGPITKVRLWGSWKNDIKGNIQKLHLSIHSDDPVGPGGSDPQNTYSKPDYLLWARDFNSTEFTESLFLDITPEYEYWWDPATGLVIQLGDQKIWQYDITIDPNQAFIQEGDPCNPIVYWLDAYVVIAPNSPAGANFGWKTSVTHWNDDAVWSTDNGITWNEMRYPPQHPYAYDSADLAFAIITGHEEEPNEPEPKWLQEPDLSETGLDVFASEPLILADDFLCTKTTLITDITVWGSWKYDILPPGGPGDVTFTLSIHSDIPDPDPCNSQDWSMPGDVLWFMDVRASAVSIEKGEIYEGWWDPRDPFSYIFPGDYTCWKYTFKIDPNDAFCQQGDPCNPIVYWLDVQAHPNDVAGGAQFGWKSSLDHWNDDAVWVEGVEPYSGLWNELRYPMNHELYGQSIDLAFAIDGNIPCVSREDFGDAPDSLTVLGYPTLLANNGARHIIDGITYLGVLVDAEGDGQPTANADGDDLNPPLADDEDGVVIPVLKQGTWSIFSVTASAAGMLDAWIDFGADNSWAEAGDQVTSSLALSAGVNTFALWIPINATPGQTYARFRFSTAGGLSPSGPAPDGEVEDYSVTIVDPNVKYLQRPDTSEYGIDIRFDRNDGIQRTLADDFECTSSGKITDVHLWCSWLEDIKGTVETIHLSIHDDIPAPNSPTGYSMPGNLLWERDFTPAQFTETLFYTLPPQQYEWWWDPYIPVVNPMGDTQIWRYDVNIPYTQAFRQTGDPNHPKVYWLDAWVTLSADSPPEAQIGWKTSIDHWNDAAVFDDPANVFGWTILLYPMGHPHQETNVDMAFAITTKPDCLKSTAPEYADWGTFGKPDCWCYQRQCRGDYNGTKVGVQWVQALDLNALVTAYGKNLTWLTQNPQYLCADFNHAKVGVQRVQANDLNILVTYYGKNQTIVTCCDLNSDCVLTPADKYLFWTN